MGSGGYEVKFLGGMYCDVLEHAVCLFPEKPCPAANLTGSTSRGAGVGCKRRRARAERETGEKCRKEGTDGEGKEDGRTE